MAGEASKTSVQDIANLLIIDEATPITPEQFDATGKKLNSNSPAEGSEEPEDDLTTDDLADEESEDQEQDDVKSEEDDDAAEEEDEDEDQDDQTFVDIRDDDVIDVMIDGKLEQRTIGDLKKAIAGEGAIEKRLQEATELRKTAHAERTTMLETLADQERLVANALIALDDSVFKAVIPAPNPALKDTNPGAYLRHKDAYDADQQRINDAKKAVAAKVKEFADQRNARLKEYGDAAAKEIARIIPELVDPQKSPAMLNELVVTAKSYGYTEQEISSALDPRMFHLVRDAMLYRKLSSRAKEVKVSDLTSKEGKGPRKLRSGNTRAKTQVAISAKQEAAAKAQARQTGNVKDVAAFLLKTKGK